MILIGEKEIRVFALDTPGCPIVCSYDIALPTSSIELDSSALEGPSLTLCVSFNLPVNSFDFIPSLIQYRDTTPTPSFDIADVQYLPPPIVIDSSQRDRFLKERPTLAVLSDRASSLSLSILSIPSQKVISLFYLFILSLSVDSISF